MNLEIISGKEEAEIIYSNHIETLLDHSQSYLYIDVGGGSTEITLFDSGKIIASQSFDVGTLRWPKGKVSGDKWENMKSWVKQNTDGHSPLTAIGSGGNINKIFKMFERKEKPMAFAKLKEFYDELKTHTIEERMEIWQLNPDRADVISRETMISVMRNVEVRIAVSIVVQESGAAAPFAVS